MGNNLRAAGTTGNTCDPIAPIGGQDETGKYQHINITNSGGIFAEQPEAATLVPYLYSPTSVPTTAALKGAGVLLSATNVHPLLTVTAGEYRINPQFIAPISNASGTTAVNFLLIKAASTFAAYIGGLTLGTSTVNPSMAQIADGLVGFWQGQTMQSVGTGAAQISTNVNSAKNVYLPIGIYTLAVVAQTALTPSDVTAYVGFTEFNRIG